MSSINSALDAQEPSLPGNNYVCPQVPPYGRHSDHLHCSSLEGDLYPLISYCQVWASLISPSIPGEEASRLQTGTES